ncbi:MAG: Fic family protein [Actinomycetota bacterium]|nr:Fic family protein [Actinomycetota bacterium]
MADLFRTPPLDLEDAAVLKVVHAMRAELRYVLRAPRRWEGVLRRTLLARAIRGSNSIEGYLITVDDAVAAVDEDEPLSTDQRTWAEIVGYRAAMSYILQLGEDPHFRYDAALFRSLHFMMLGHDLTKSPGRYRQGPIYVRDEATGEAVYEGSDWQQVADLMDALAESLESDRETDPVVKAALAHLNLVMVHPFRDGNGRMARAVQTLVLARESIVAPQFASIEEWLGANTQIYYAVLAATGAGGWHPERDTSLLVKFTLRAHHMQAQTVRRRVEVTQHLWTTLEDVVAEEGLPPRTAHALLDAALGLRVRRPGYARLADVEERTPPATSGCWSTAGCCKPWARPAGASTWRGRGCAHRRLRPRRRPRRSRTPIPGSRPRSCRRLAPSRRRASHLASSPPARDCCHLPLRWNQRRDSLRVWHRWKRCRAPIAA